MLLSSHKDLSIAGDPLTAMETRLLAGNYNMGMLKAYYDQVVALHQVERGRWTLSQLMAAEPQDKQVISLWIAICLLQKDYYAAMAGIETMLATSIPDDGLLDAGLSVRTHLQCKSIKNFCSGEARISLCMIVKNEEGGLGACLNTVKGLVDEIVIVDTGSSDRTIDVARIFGARIYEFQWSDDFSEARNISLEMAKGDWVLVLDADEIIAPKDHHRLRQLVHLYKGKESAFSIETRNYSHLVNTVGWQANVGEYSGYEAGLGWFPSRKVRLFPRISGIRFRYPVHELVEPTLRNLGIPIVPCSIPIHHYGQLSEIQNQNKSKKYFKLGYAKLNQMTEGPGALRELAVQAGQMNRWAEAIEIWQRLLEKKPNFAEAYVNISSAYWQMGKYQDALSYGYKAVELDPHLKEAHFNVGVSFLLSEQAQMAIGVLQPLLQTCTDYYAARFMLAAALACCGDVANSHTHFQILESSPAGKALSLAIEDLTHRLRRNRQKSYADALEHAGRLLHKDHPTDS